MKKLWLILLVGGMLAGCNSPSNAPAEKPKPKAPDLLTGRSAFQQLFVAARGWATDAKPYQLQSLPTSDANGHDGKAALWRAAFASASQSASRPYVWSGADSPDSSRGVSPGTQDSFLPGNAFDVAFLKIDSDKAFETAQKHGGDKVLQEASATPVSYFLDWNRGENHLVWHVIYGSNRNDAKLIVDIDASTGDFVRKEK